VLPLWQCSVIVAVVVLLLGQIRCVGRLAPAAACWWSKFRMRYQLGLPRVIMQSFALNAKLVWPRTLRYLRLLPRPSAHAAAT
jgi:hypothetical protein